MRRVGHEHGSIRSFLLWRHPFSAEVFLDPFALGFRQHAVKNNALGDIALPCADRVVNASQFGVIFKGGHAKIEWGRSLARIYFYAIQPDIGRF